MGLAAVRIVTGRVRDALGVLSLHRSVLEEGRFFVSKPEEFGVDVAQAESFLQQLLDAPASTVLVARLRGVPVAGFVTVVSSPLARLAHVGRFEIMVGRAHRGQGVGRALLAQTVAWADQDPDLEKLSLSVFDDNERAIALYREFGFEEEGRREREYRESDGSYRGDVLMARWCKSVAS